MHPNPESSEDGKKRKCFRVVVLVRQTFFESLELHLNVKANLLLLVQFGCEVIQAFLMRSSEVFKIAAKLLQLGVHVASIVV